MKAVKLLILGLTLVSASTAQTNVTVKLDIPASSAYVDGIERENSFIDNSIDFGQISDSKPVGILSYLGQPSKATFNDGQSISMTSTLSNKGSEFLITNTRGGIESINDRKEEVQSHSLLEKLNPSIGFQIGAEREIKVSYEFPYKIHKYKGVRRGINNLLVRNRIHSGNTTQLVIRGD